MISIHYDPSVEMMDIQDEDGRTVFYGNYWDIPQDPYELAKFLTKLGLEVGINRSVIEEC